MKIIGIIGKTSSGKDTISRYLYKKYCIEPIISYTTRPMRESEVDGREHWFVDDKKMDEVLSDKTKILAFMENPDTGRRYCASIYGLKDDRTYTYIINPIAWERMVAEHPEIEFIGIYCDLSESKIRNRAILRGDSLKAIKDRLDDEREEFDSFKEKKFGEKKIADKNDANEFPKLYLVSTAASRDVVEEKVDTILGKLNDGWLNWR